MPDKHIPWAALWLALAIVAPAIAKEADQSAGGLHAVRVAVVDGKGQPVAGAWVEMSDRALAANWLKKTPGAVIVATTGDDGKAVLRLPAAAWLNPIVALKVGLGLDYFFMPHATFNAPRQDLPEEIVLTLAGARTLKIKIVDGDQKPLPGIILTAGRLTTPGKRRRLSDRSGAFGVDLSACEGTTATSDAEGVATFAWLPSQFEDRIDFRIVSAEFRPSHRPGAPRPKLELLAQKPVDEITLELTRHFPLSGRVTFPDGKPAEKMAVTAEGLGRSGAAIRVFAHTDVKGRYEMMVEGNGDWVYSVGVEDSQWVATPVDGLAVGSQRVENVDLRLGPGTLLHVEATQGDERRPLNDLQVLVARLIERPFADGAAAGQGNRFAKINHSLKTTDERGKCTFRVAPGTYDVALHDLRGTTVVVDAQAELVHDAHLPTGDLKTLRGTVTDLQRRPQAGAVVKGIYSAGPYHFDTTVVTAADGSFQLQRERLPLVLQAESADGQHRGIAAVQVGEERVEIGLSSLSIARGRLLDAGGQPLVSGKLEYGVWIIGYKHYKLLFRGEARPDAQGRFQLDGLMSAGGHSYKLNYWPDADTQLDPQRSIPAPENREPSVDLKPFKVLADDPTDLGDLRPLGPRGK